MSVPKSKRSTPKSGYVVCVGQVLDSTKRLMRKWPKSRNNTEVAPTIEIAYKAFEAAMNAHCIYAVLPNEHALKMQKLYECYGAVNTLAGLFDRWVMDTPKVKISDKECNEAVEKVLAMASGESDENRTIKDRYRKVVPMKKLENYASTLVQALASLSGAIKRERKELQISLEKHPGFSIFLPL